MKTTRVAVAAALLLASALLPVSTELRAYQIIEGRYRVEVSPGVFEDQLVVRCDDGRTLTVRWETKLAEACGESLMGGPAPKAARAAAPSPAPKAAQSPQAAPQTKTAPEPPPAAATPAGLLDEQSQKDAMLAQVRAQFGDVPEHYVEFKPGPDGLSMRFLPPLSDILKKYEMCRKVRETRADCAADRDNAIAKLSATRPPAAAGTDKAVDKANPAVAGDDKSLAPPAKAAAPSETPAPAAASPQAHAAPAQPDAAAAAAADRVAAEQKILEEYTWCMRAKPKFECEQARAKALSALDKPKPAAKPKRAPKQAAAPNVAATAR
ncbi:MAG TPA: hypothetical protein VD791_02620 [Burkholderiales bacterium]|nr:hypothetical protein [Burkholderiales bacterium]